MFSFQNAKNDSIAELKTRIAEKTQKLVCNFQCKYFTCLCGDCPQEDLEI